MLIGVKGAKDSGKSTVAKYLTNNYSLTEEYFSKPLKEIISILTGWDIDFINGTTPEYKIQRETIKHPEYGMTCRQLLQYIGTDLFRNQIDPNIWVNIMKRRIQNSEDVVISDCRFPEECSLIQELGGIIIYLKRDTGHLDNHISEQEFKTNGEFIIHNDGSLNDLYAKIDSIVQMYVD